MRSGIKVLLLSVVTTGCFTDISTDPAPMMIGHTDGDPCPQGSPGCACYGNGTCDAGLGCAADENVCVPPGCEPGMRACLCDEGECSGELVCVGSVCRVPGDDTGTTASSSQGPFTSGPLDTGNEETPSGTTDEGDEASTTVSGDDTGPDKQCDDLDCGECAECVVMPAMDCSDLAAACEAEPGCLTAAECMVACGVEGICFDNCCEIASEDAAAAAQALNVCRSDRCTSACDEYLDALCV